MPIPRIAASYLHWENVQHFERGEWPEGVLNHMDSSVILLLMWVRIKAGHPAFPSPDPEAHVRHSGTSRHSIDWGNGVKRLSDATDFFVSWRGLFPTYGAALASRAGGIGVYLDTTWKGSPMPMIHIDNRKDRVMWVRVDGQYIYFHHDPQRYLQELSTARVR